MFRSTMRLPVAMLLLCVIAWQYGLIRLLRQEVARYRVAARLAVEERAGHTGLDEGPRGRPLV